MRDTENLITVSIDYGVKDHTALCFSRGGEVQFLYGPIAMDVYNLLNNNVTRHRIKVHPRKLFSKLFRKNK